MRLFSYKMVADTGFAPNPFFGVMTLATCKPGMRKSKRVGDWIAGFTSKTLCGDPVGRERLVFLMQIDRKMPIADYFRDPEFAARIPRLDEPDFVHHAGDNIYRPLCNHATMPDEFEQLPNRNHWDHKNHCESEFHKRRDVGGKNVLLATTFSYFGREPVEIPDSVRPAVPKGQSGHGSRTWDESRAVRFVQYVRDTSGVGVHGPPHKWPSGDMSWRML